MTTHEAKQIPLVSVLASLGFGPERVNAHQAVYLSPFSPDERTASFYVSIKLNGFKCFSTGKMGDVIRFIQEFKAVSFTNALAYLQNLNICPQTNFLSFNGQSDSPSENALTILKIKTLENRALLDYLRQRCINPDVAAAYCQEIYYQAPNSKRYFALAFANDNGGYELRNAYFKNSTSPKAITTIKGTSSQRLNITEGFFDFLSMLTMRSTVRPLHDTVVLNSNSLLHQIKPILPKYESIQTYLDHDPSGVCAVETIRTMHKNVTDGSGFYAAFKDVNEYLISKPNMANDSPDNHR